MILLETAAAKLRPLLDEIVFVGGCTTGLFISDPAAASVRKTYDVDVIAEIASYAEYAEFSDRLRSLGFNEDTSAGAPLCRWQGWGLKLDVMPLDEKVLGFSNRWYGGALQEAQGVTLPSGTKIRVITPPYFLGTKVEAFRGRGKGDYALSHDLEDIVAVVDGREAIVAEVERTDMELRRYIGDAIASYLNDSRFLDALPGLLLPDAASQARISIIIERLYRLAAS